PSRTTPRTAGTKPGTPPSSGTSTAGTAASALGIHYSPVPVHRQTRRVLWSSRDLHSDEDHAHVKSAGYPPRRSRATPIAEPPTSGGQLRSGCGEWSISHDER